MDLFDITKAAQTYSSISVVLAGFSFAVLMYVIQSTGSLSEETSTDDADKGLTLIALTFLGNIVIAVLWGMVSGEPSRKMRPEILGFVATLLFASNTPLTFQAVALFVAASGRTRLVRLFRWIYLFTIMMAAIFIIENVAFLHAEIQAVPKKADPQPLHALNSVYGQYLIVFLAIILLLAWLVNLSYKQTLDDACEHRSRMTLRRRVGIAASTTFKAFTFAWLGGGLVLVTFFAWVSMWKPDTIVPIGWIYALAFFCSLFNGWAVTFTPRSKRQRSDDRGSRTRHGGSSGKGAPPFHSFVEVEERESSASG